jgi:hypothetical protein
MFTNTKRRIKSTKAGPVAESADLPPQGGFAASYEGLGLRVLHEPHTQATTTVNIIFVHGLGGSSLSTWTSTTRSKAFWPTLLHDDDRLPNARISTFGYDADFKNIFAVDNTLNVAEFAKQLIDGLELHYDTYGNVSVPCSCGNN